MNNNLSKTSRSPFSLGLLACVLGILLALGGCHRSAPDENASQDAGKKSPAEPDDAAKSDATAAGAGDAAKEEGPEGTVVLTPEETEKMGIVTAAARAVSSAPEATGFATVVAHEQIATAVAELRTASAAERQSRSAYERTKRLAGTQGAMAADVQETAQRQAVTDATALELVKQRLTSTFGQDPPWKSAQDSPELTSLADGQSKLVRVTFPLGAIEAARPNTARLSPLDFSPDAKSWQSQSLWRAPADPNMPGVSFFAVLKNTEIAEGDHLIARAPIGAPEDGVLVPAAAAVIADGKFWCFVEPKPGTFVRIEFDPNHAMPGGYFVQQGIRPGDQIVIAAAGQLLARQTNPSTEADD